MAKTKAMLGSKVRRLRRDQGRTQVQLAEELGISASYLNLIEHDQRPVTAPLLIKLSKVLGVGMSTFDEDEEVRLAADLAEVFGDPLFREVELGTRDFRELAEASPAACQAVLKLYHAYRGSRADAQALAEQLSDEEQTLGLEGTRAPSEEVSDFLQGHANHFPDLELAAEALWKEIGSDADLERGLSGFLLKAHGVRVDVVSSAEASGAVRRFHAASRRLVLSEVLPPRSRNFQLAHQIALLSHLPLLDHYVQEGPLTADDSRALGRVALANYFAGAVLMPYERFLDAARSVRYDIEMLGHRFRTSFEQVCHRLTTMQRPGNRGVPFHMIRVDIAGNISKRFSASGIRFARYSGVCPRWNVHAAFLTPGFIRTQMSRMPDSTTYFCLARTVRKEGGGYQVTPSRLAIGLGCEVVYAPELVYADGVDLENLDASVPVGITCRLCERSDCAQRAFPALRQHMNINENVRGLSFYGASVAEGGE